MKKRKRKRDTKLKGDKEEGHEVKRRKGRGTRSKKGERKRDTK